MNYPLAIDPNQVGEYDQAAYTGGGYFFDEVLEYRVWCHSNDELETAHYGHDDMDTYQAFATYEQALAFAHNTQHVDPPVVLIRQLEWIDQPSRGVFIHHKGDRITQWQVEWLANGKRKTEAIAEFLLKSAQSK